MASDPLAEPDEAPGQEEEADDQGEIDDVHHGAPVRGGRKSARPIYAAQRPSGVKSDGPCVNEESRRSQRRPIGWPRWGPGVRGVASPASVPLSSR